MIEARGQKLPESMHDWTLESIDVDWHHAVVKMRLNGPISASTVIARNFSEIVVPRQNAWGPSDSVNSVRGPEFRSANMQSLEIEMQSGDLIRVVAETISITG